MPTQPPKTADSPQLRSFRIGEWLVLPTTNKITRKDVTHRLEPKIMQTLVYLARRSGNVCTRVELFTTIWKGLVVNDETLTRVISQLRGILGDDPRHPAYIETIYKTGYRMVMPVEAVGDEPSGETCAAAGGVQGSTLNRSRVLRGAIILVLLLVFGITMHAFRLPESPTPSAPWAERPLTSFPGVEFSPALSADGTRLAFAWNKRNSRCSGIWIKTIADNSLQRVIEEDGIIDDISWSPDGGQLVYCYQDSGAGVAIIDVDGHSAAIAIEECQQAGGADWAPCGKKIIYSSRGGIYDPFTLKLHDLESGPLDFHPAGFTSRFGNVSPRFSPDGMKLAFIHLTDTQMMSIVVVDMGDGGSYLLADSLRTVTSLDWTTDGESLLLATAPDDNHILERINLASGDRTRVQLRGKDISGPTVASRCERLAYMDIRENTDILRASLPSHGAAHCNDLSIIANSTRMDIEPRYSPNGEQIAFVSDRGGFPEIWVCDRTGGNARQWSHFDGPDLENPVWAPDGESIAVTAIQRTHSTIRIVDMDGSTHDLIHNASRDVRQWSADGQWLFFSCIVDTGKQYRRMRRDGSGAEGVLSPGDIMLDGDYVNDTILYLQHGTRDLRALDLVDGGDELLRTAGNMVGWFGRKSGSDGLYFMCGDLVNIHIGQLDFASGRIDTLAVFDSLYLRGYHMAPDRSDIIFDSFTEFSSDIVMVDNFR
ncbi:MAG: hypothetical protein GY835_25585 [bacterium]|nr:hypothetical protein [bacterium]